MEFRTRATVYTYSRSCTGRYRDAEAHLSQVVRMSRMREDRFAENSVPRSLCRLVLRAFGVGRELLESERPSSREFSCNAKRDKECLFFRYWRRSACQGIAGVGTYGTRVCLRHVDCGDIDTRTAVGSLLAHL